MKVHLKMHGEAVFKRFVQAAEKRKLANRVCPICHKSLDYFKFVRIH